MRLLITVIFCFINFASHSQAEIGIGILSISFDEQTTIDFYKTSDLEEKIQTIEFFDDEKINSLNIKDLENHKNWLQPETLWLDYYQFNFRVKSKSGECFEIYVSDNQTMWIKNKKITDFLTWEEYLKRMFSITRKNPNGQKIFKKPDLEAKEIQYSNEDCFRVKKMSGDWIEIFTPEHCADEIENPIKTGWIKWKKGNKLLIYYHSIS